MIALALDVRPIDSSLWMEMVMHRIGRFDTVTLTQEQSIVHMPGVGSLLVDRVGAGIRFQAIVRDEAQAQRVQAAVTDEISAAVPESLGGRRLELEWSRPSAVPVPLR